MRLFLPNSAFLGNINPFIQNLDLTNPGVLEISAHKSWISVHPVVLCMVASLGIKARNQGGQSAIKCERFTASSKHYFERMGLFNFLQLDSEMTIVEHESAGRFIPLTQIKSSDSLTNFIKEMIPLLHLDQKNAEPIKYIVSELVRNVLEHSSSDNGAIVSAQYYKKSNTIRIGIVDSGVGISRTIRKSHVAETDIDAIRLALTPGITGTTHREGGTDFNAGAGLFFIKSIAKTNRDFFMLYSGNALYKLLREKDGNDMMLYADPLLDKHSQETNLPYWQGTAVGIDIQLDETEEFTRLLEAIRNIYAKTVRDRRKAKYRKPKFI